ncbi:Csu type fimbrial protein [Acinetobacter variabilis]|uniref:Csu type fimbrial protein n=1 Tax=Acinetobacter variabilis TaxID=70346 RepID=UPI0025500AAA|nr:spore coat U domain-containing protein [Acinetobacter variabilis]
MQFKKKFMSMSLLAISSLTTLSTAMAANSVTGQFKVKIQIDSACNFSTSEAQDINFGNVLAGTLASEIQTQTSATALSVKCSKGTPYIVNLTPSNGNTTGAGLMTHTAGKTDTISYQLKSDSTGLVWGNTGTSGAKGNSVSGIGKGMSIANEHAVYASIESTTDVNIGNYTDTVTVSVIY